MGENRALAILNYAFLLAGLAAIAAILSAAMVMQYAFGELPCPLCLLERLAMFGAAFGMIRNLRGPYASRNSGLTLIFALFLLIVSVRQTLLDIYPRPGHEYVGSAVLGLHLPVWSVLIAVALIGAYAVKLAVLGGDAHMRGAEPAEFPAVRVLGTGIAAYVVLLCLINLGSVVVQCGLAQCHTTGYALLSGPPPASP